MTNSNRSCWPTSASRTATPWPFTSANGGYNGLRKVLAEMTPAQVIEMVKASNLRGRGGAGFPTGLKWTFLPKDHPGPIYMCINADESEPGTFNNRILMEDDPHQVLEGIILSCYATQGHDGLHLSSATNTRCPTIGCKRPSTSSMPTACLGKNILGKEFSLDIYHSSRGRRLHLRRGNRADRKPGRQAGLAADQAAVSGRRGRVPQADGRQQHRDGWPASRKSSTAGVEWFKSIGVPPDPKNPRDPGSYGPKLYCLSGHVNKPGCYEAPLGITCRQLIDEYGGGVWKGRKGKAAIPGGISMGLMTEAEFDTPLDFAGPGKVGCLGLGTAAVVVIDETVSIVDFLHNSCRFFAHESCGQCTPCREGTAWSLHDARPHQGRARAGSKDLDCCWRSATRSASFPARRFAAWPTAPPGR